MNTKRSNQRVTNRKFGLIRTVAFVNGENRNEQHYVHKNGNVVVEVKRIPSFRRPTLY